MIGDGVKIDPDDVASRINPGWFRERDSRYIDGGKCTVAQQIPMKKAVAVIKVPDDVATQINPVCAAEIIGSRWINGRKCTVAQQIPMSEKATVTIESDDLASRVDPEREGVQGSRDVDLRDCVLEDRAAWRLLRGEPGRGW